MTLLLCALVGFVLAQYFKLALQLKTAQHHWAKMIVALFGSVGTAVWLEYGHWKYVVIYGVAGAGLGMLVHKIYRAVAARGDESIHSIISKRQR